MPLREGLAFRLGSCLGDLEFHLSGPQLSHLQNGEVGVVLSKCPSICNISCLDSNHLGDLVCKEFDQQIARLCSHPSEGYTLLTCFIQICCCDQKQAIWCKKVRHCWQIPVACAVSLQFAFKFLV